jgi:hypothetical protein
LKDKDERREKNFRRNIKKVETPGQESLNKSRQELVKLLIESIYDVEHEDGWAYIGDLMKILLKKKPDFDTRTYGYERLLPLIKSLKKFEIESRETVRKDVKHIYVRVKE